MSLTYGPTALPDPPDTISQVTVKTWNGSTPTFTSAPALDGSNRLSFAVSKADRYTIKVSKPFAISTYHVYLGTDEGEYQPGEMNNPITDPAAARPTGIPAVVWVTPTMPANAASNDLVFLTGS